MQTVIFDIDGTLADVNHRRHHLKGKSKDWPAFFAEMDEDSPNERMVQLCRVLAQAGYRILLLTGRPGNFRETTEEWLARFDIPYDELRMRGEGDFRSDAVLKPEMAADLRPEEVLFVVEDRAEVTRAWRKAGFVCLACEEADY